jgi:hypothetical protein
MSTNNTFGTIFIRENTLLPAGLSIESEVFLLGWKVVKNLDGSALARNIEGANWNFFYLAGEIRSTALGRDRLGTLRRAVKRALAKQDKQFNSLEITKVVSKRFLGIPFMRPRCVRKQAGSGQRTAPCRRHHKAVCGSNFKFLGIRERYENENIAQLDSLSCCPAPYGAIAPCTGSFQVSALYPGNEFDQLAGAY